MILPIARMGQPILQQRAQEVTDIAAESVQQLIKDMIETFKSLHGIGVAAPQVFQPLRIVTFELPEEIAQARGYHAGIPLTVLINPQIEFLTDELELGWEGCFSLPGMMGQVPRCKAIRYRALTADGSILEREVEGYHARIVQHECDHLDGILYPMRMHDMSRFGFVEEIKQALAK